MADRKVPHSLQKQTADQIRNEQRGGADSPIDPNRDNGPEANATMRRVWDEPGGEAYNYRNSTVEGVGGWSVPTPGDPGGHGDLTAAETPETTKHLSDATLGPDDRDATGEAIARAAAAGEGKPDGRDEPQHATPTTHTPRNPGGIASSLQPGGTIPGGGPGASTGSIGTGGGSTGGAPTGSVKRSGA